MRLSTSYTATSHTPKSREIEDSETWSFSCRTFGGIHMHRWCFLNAMAVEYRTTEMKKQELKGGMYSRKVFRNSYD